MNLISIDPSKNNFAFAWYKSKHPQKYGIMKTTIENAKSLFKNAGEFILAIETQYYGANIKTMIDLVEARSMLETVACMYNCKGIYEIPPNVWQKVMLDINGRTTRKIRKKKSLDLASSLLYNDIEDDNIADAIILGRFVLSNSDNLFKFFKEVFL